MLRICPLFSGSEGNSVLIKSDKTSILIDIGRSSKQIEKSLIENGFIPSEVRYIFITHEHIDHVRGLKTFSKKYRPKIFASRGTIEQLIKKQLLDLKLKYTAISLSEIEFEDFVVTAFEISHDCKQGFGYSIYFKNFNLKISICSDSGMILPRTLKSISGSDVVVIESNHDIDMLKSGPYPLFLKERILSERGHLSNADCCKLLSYLALHGTKKFILYHLSSINNTPEIAYNLAIKTLEEIGIKDCQVYVAPKVNTGLLNIEI